MRQLNRKLYVEAWLPRIVGVYYGSESSYILEDELTDSWPLGHLVKQGHPLKLSLYAIALHQLL